jgi:2-polyprenyl-3-methyl-5-hydroxy-6-metoxy-1,4-benzoquinol methylase
MPTNVALKEYYSTYYRGFDRKITISEPQRFARHIAGFMPELFKKTEFRILDFGGGDGSVSHAIGSYIRSQAARGVKCAIDLVDYEVPCLSESKDTIINGYHDLNAVEGPFDIILASAILEHIPKVHDVIVQLTKMAGPGTVMYARTPYVLPFAKIIPGFDITYPAHVHDMGSHFWQRFVTTFGLKAEIIRSSPSIVETAFADAPLRTVAAYILKSPARIEQLIFGHNRRTLWNFVGGWEVVVKFN